MGKAERTLIQYEQRGDFMKRYILDFDTLTEHEEGNLVRYEETVWEFRDHRWRCLASDCNFISFNKDCINYCSKCGRKIVYVGEDE